MKSSAAFASSGAVSLIGLFIKGLPFLRATDLVGSSGVGYMRRGVRDW